MVRPGHMCILGDFNIHVGIPNDSENKHLTSILSSFDQVQHVHGPTHSRGHTLDLIIMKKENKLTNTFIGEMISDHNLIYGFLNFRKPEFQTKTISYRKIKSIDIDDFSKDIQSIILAPGGPRPRRE